MINKVIKYIEEHQLIEPQDKIIVGVSGGADSVCLLILLLNIQKRYGLELIVVHVEHGIRGNESLGDALFVKTLAEKQAVSYEEYSYSITECAKEWGMSVEEAGRTARYQAFEEVRKLYQADKIAVAHNQDDNAETLLHHLFRGSGLNGLTGISPKREAIIRPLLCVSRKEIEDFLRQRGQSFRVDSTNLSKDYTRNKIRLEILPVIERNINEKVKEQLNQTAIILSEVKEYMKQEGEKAYRECATETEQKIYLDAEAFIVYPIALKKEVIQCCLIKCVGGLKNISSKHIESILQISEKQVGKEINLPGKWIVKKEYERIVFQKKERRVNRSSCSDNDKRERDIVPNEAFDFGGLHFTCEIIPCQLKENIPEKPYTKWFDYDKIKSTLRLRYRKAGDYIEINKSGGKKKCKDYFIDQKIPKEERDCIPMLADDSHILWMIGYRISEGYKITRDTKYILKVQVNGGLENGR